MRVARVNGEYVINPTFEQMKHADMDLMVGATKDNIMMVEGEMDEVSEQDLIGALKAAHEAIKPMCEMQEELSKACGTDVKREYDDESMMKTYANRYAKRHTMLAMRELKAVTTIRNIVKKLMRKSSLISLKHTIQHTLT